VSRVGVIHIVDSLEPGGYERVAVTLANALPRERYRAFVCATRRGGPLETAVEKHVDVLVLGRKGTFDRHALGRLTEYVRAYDVRILHPHGPSLFLARAAALLARRTAVLWHAHAGRYAAEDRRDWRYRGAVAGIAGVVGANEPLVEWMRRRLGVPAERSWYLPNPVEEARDTDAAADLPGVRGKQIVCVGNLRPEKDHPMLLRAMAEVVRGVPEAHLLLAGAAADAAYEGELRAVCAQLRLERNVSFLGRRTDTGSVLRACDIGVLSSRFEGLPMALLEYAMAGLPVVSTAAGQCGEVLDGGRAGILVQPGDWAGLARGLAALLASVELRASLGAKFRERVKARHGAAAIAERLCSIYETAVPLAPGRGSRHAAAARDAIIDRI
jgi:glycosyltransferase involved in cell wall biosynthesis